MKFSSEALSKLGASIAKKEDLAFLDKRTCVTFYGTSSEVMAECWKRIEGKVAKGAKPKHILWTCMFMKLCRPEDVMCILLNASKPTLKKWVWEVMESLALTSIDVIDWEKRKRNLPPNDLCSISVDGTDFKTQEPWPFNKQMMSHRFKGSALKCEIAISIFSGNIVWMCGPHCGAKHDLTIFREHLKHLLEEGQMAEADQGHKGDDDFVCVQNDYFTKAEKKEKGRVRNRQETINRRFICWDILKQECRHD